MVVVVVVVEVVIISPALQDSLKAQSMFYRYQQGDDRLTNAYTARSRHIAKPRAVPPYIDTVALF